MARVGTSPRGRGLGLAILATGAAAGCGGTGSEPAGSAAASEALNVVLISLDTCRADALSCYGSERETPHLDRFAAESVLFEDCLAQSSGTAPSHMSLFTGQYVHRHGLASNDIAIEPPPTLASELRDAGWATAAFTGHGSLRAKLGHAHGFEVFESWTGEDRWPHTRNFDEVIPAAEAWLQGAPEPFFLLVHGYDPHCPYWPPESEREAYAGWYDGALEPEELCGINAFQPFLADGSLGADEKRYLRDLYDAEIAAADRQLGAFLDGLRESGVLDRSIVVFTSDHGEALGEHDWIGHTRMWEEELDVPLLIRFPDGRWSRRIAAPAQHVDVVPTILSALSLESPSGVQGFDWMPHLRGEAAAHPDERLRISFFHRYESFRFDDRTKVSFFRDRDNRPKDVRAVDLTADPSEQVNLFELESERPRIAELFQRYQAWRASTVADDQRLGGRRSANVRAEDAELLNALGYTGED